MSDVTLEVEGLGGIGETEVEGESRSLDFAATHMLLRGGGASGRCGRDGGRPLLFDALLEGWDAALPGAAFAFATCCGGGRGGARDCSKEKVC